MRKPRCQGGLCKHQRLFLLRRPTQSVSWQLMLLKSCSSWFNTLAHSLGQSDLSSLKYLTQCGTIRVLSQVFFFFFSWLSYLDKILFSLWSRSHKNTKSDLPDTILTASWESNLRKWCQGRKMDWEDQWLKSWREMCVRVCVCEYVCTHMFMNTLVQS